MTIRVTEGVQISVHESSAMAAADEQLQVLVLSKERSWPPRSGGVLACAMEWAYGGGVGSRGRTKRKGRLQCAEGEREAESAGGRGITKVQHCHNLEEP